MVYPFTSARVINVLILTLILSGQACAHFHARSTQLKSHIPRAKDNVRGSHGVKKRWPEDRSRKATKGPNIVFPKSYHATGLLTLPYDGIMEPFEIWYAEKHRMSRIDYYHGVDKTFQRGDLDKYGVYIKEIPKHKTKVGHNTRHSTSCWYQSGKKNHVVKAQSIIPMDLSHYKVVGEEYRSGTLTMKLRRHVMTGNLNNTFTLWVSKTKPHRPIRYETVGFDLLIRAHYDHYFLDYVTFDEWIMDFDVMQIPEASWCHNASLKVHSRYIVNPMSEFVHPHHELNKHSKQLEDAFSKFKRDHTKSYSDDREHANRKNIYRHNARFVRSKNRARLNYTLELNHLADLTPEEFRLMDDLLDQPDEGTPDVLRDQFPKRGEVPTVHYHVPSQPLPENLDWREYDVLTPIRGQSLCGSCWAFSTVGMLEGAYKIATGKNVQFSAQMLVDCTYGFNNYGCRGGWPWKAMQWVIKNGIATKDSYGRYLAQEGLCHCGPKENCTIIQPTSFGDIFANNETAMRVNVATYGPVSVGINSAPKSFKFYRNGIYDDMDCDDKTQHSVLIVGYGKKADFNYWTIKNSWGPFWGRKGYMKISRDDDVCGILSSNGVVANFRNDSKGFPFERMKKVVTPYLSDIEDHMKDDAFKPIFNSIPFN